MSSLLVLSEIWLKSISQANKFIFFSQTKAIEFVKRCRLLKKKEYSLRRRFVTSCDDVSFACNNLLDFGLHHSLLIYLFLCLKKNKKKFTGFFLMGELQGSCVFLGCLWREAKPGRNSQVDRTKNAIWSSVSLRDYWISLIKKINKNIDHWNNSNCKVSFSKVF